MCGFRTHYRWGQVETFTFDYGCACRPVYMWLQDTLLKRTSKNLYLWLQVYVSSCLCGFRTHDWWGRVKTFTFDYRCTCRPIQRKTMCGFRTPYWSGRVKTFTFDYRCVYRPVYVWFQDTLVMGTGENLYLWLQVCVSSCPTENYVWLEDYNPVTGDGNKNNLICKDGVDTSKVSKHGAQRPQKP